MRNLWFEIMLIVGTILLVSIPGNRGFAQGKLEVHTSSNVQFLVIDPLGRKTGFDVSSNLEYSGIPSSHYDILASENTDPAVPNIDVWEAEIGVGPDLLLNGNYWIKVGCQQAGSYSLDMWVLRGSSSQHFKANGIGAAGQSYLYGFVFNTNPSYPITLSSFQSTGEVKGGILNPYGTSTLSIRAKPSIAFGTLDTLVSATATIRWQSRYSLSLGAISSPTYGFVAVGSVVTQGNYKYQEFATILHTSASWAANTEYELFTVPVNGSAGVEDFGLTNALAGGAISIQIDNIERADTTFYQPVATCTGLTSQNKADNGAATAFNGARHLAMTSTKLHEVYNSGGEIVYRRKSLTGSWEITQRISSDSTGNNNDPNIILAHDGSVHVVWQQLLTSTTYALYYNRSTDGGTTWGKPATITGGSNISINQGQWNIYPVIAEYGTSQIVVVCCYSGGLEYNTSSDLGQSWSNSMTSTGAQGGDGYQGYIWYPSLARLNTSDNLIVTYDSRYNGVWSQVYNGTSWSTEGSASAGIGTYYDRYSSVAADNQNRPIAAWCAQDARFAEYFIMCKTGNTDGTWGSGFVQFAVDAPSVSDLYPSVTYVNRSGLYGLDIVYANSNNGIKVNQYAFYWQSPVLLSTSGQWANTTMQNTTTSTGAAIRVWTGQSANPYQVTLQSDGTYNLSKSQAQEPTTADFHRRIVVESQRTRSTISFDLAPLKVVTTANDTVAVPFKTLDMTKPFTATIANAWDYLGTDQITLPSNARSLILETDIRSQAHQDTLGKAGTNVFTSSSFRFDGVKASQSVPLLSNQAGLSGRKVIDVTAQAGQAITLRMIGTVPATATEPVTIGIGDVYITSKP